MLSYQGDSGLKARFVGHVLRHQAEDRVLQGTYGLIDESGQWKGCAVACSLRSLDEVTGVRTVVDNRSHGRLAERLGIPLELAYLEDRTFEGLSVELARGWPARFAEAIPVGRDLTMVWARLALWMLSDPESGVLRLARSERTKSGIAGVVALYQRWVDGEKPSVEEWRKARAARRRRRRRLRRRRLRRRLRRRRLRRRRRRLRRRA
jgi:hypothetical protein